RLDWKMFDSVNAVTLVFSLEPILVSNQLLIGIHLPTFVFIKRKHGKSFLVTLATSVARIVSPVGSSSTLKEAQKEQTVANPG
ncbi:MAG: hypothetical protein AB2746_03535, partial [Candidatus Thiodiazotropha taylori]